MSGVTRELKKIGQTMGSVATQEGLAHFLGIPKNAQEVNGLVEDIRDALMDYQVWLPQKINSHRS